MDHSAGSVGRRAGISDGVVDVASSRIGATTLRGKASSTPALGPDALLGIASGGSAAVPATLRGEASAGSGAGLGPGAAPAVRATLPGRGASFSASSPDQLLLLGDGPASTTFFRGSCSTVSEL